MAKKSMIARERKREKMVAQYAKKREALMAEFDSAANQQEKVAIHSAPTRRHNRCWLTGRPRGYSRDFGLCRNKWREMAHQGLLPGVVKSSW